MIWYSMICGLFSCKCHIRLLFSLQMKMLNSTNKYINTVGSEQNDLTKSLYFITYIELIKCVISMIWKLKNHKHSLSWTTNLSELTTKRKVFSGFRQVLWDKLLDVYYSHLSLVYICPNIFSGNMLVGTYGTIRWKMPFLSTHRIVL